MRRKIIEIDEGKCTGCGLCIPNCPEGALQVIDGKARVVSDLLCDGLGACIGHCPEDAIRIVEREAEPYDERRVMENIVKGGANLIRAHLDHMREHGQSEYLAQAEAFLRGRRIAVPGSDSTPAGRAGGGSPHGGCPGARVMDMRGGSDAAGTSRAQSPSRLSQWPVQIRLVPPEAPFFRDADLLIAADCVPFAYADFHEDLLRGRTLLVGCPKFDDTDMYREKIAAILELNEVRSVTVARMEVPCCYGLVRIVEEALQRSGKDSPFEEVVIGIRGERL